MTEFFNSIAHFFTQTYITFIAVMSSFGIIDLIDILVVAFLIYKVIEFVRGTRAKQLIYGVFLFVIVWLISDLLSMRTLSSLLSAVLTQGVVALAVIFQPEIRSALELLSTSKFKINKNDYSNAEQVEACIEAVCSACADFQKSKTGALIVFEKDVKLGDIIKTGTVVDSVAKPEIIRNIFFPNTPLHDGAMIIRSGRVYAAGCILPLTSNFSIGKDLGTRHRASLGMSENSDAIVVVVSEETGVISVAQKGNLTRNYNQFSLLEFLKGQLIAEQPSKKSVFNMIKGGRDDEE